MSEIWKPIPGYEGYYASNLGNIKGIKGWILKPHVDKITGYSNVILCKGNERKGMKVHRLVWMAFNGPIPENLEVNHIKDNVAGAKQDNRLENLELLTHEDNCNYGTRNERIKATKRRNGVSGLNYKKVAQVSPDFKLIKVHASLKEASVSTGAFVSNISACCKDKDKTAKGFHWVIVPADCQDVEQLIRNHFE